MSPGRTVEVDIAILNSESSTEIVVGNSLTTVDPESDFVIATIATTPRTTVDMAIAASIIAVMPRVHELSFESICDGFSAIISEVISCLS
jgi:hypothetical protein